MVILIEIFGVLLLSAGVYLYLSARDTAVENRRLQERLEGQDELMRGFEARLRYLEARVCGSGVDPALPAPPTANRLTMHDRLPDPPGANPESSPPR